MPTHGQLAHAHHSRTHPHAYDAGKLRAIQSSFETRRRLEREQRAEQRKRDAEAKERRAAARWLASETAGLAAQQRAEARAELDTLRSSPLYGLYTRWGKRTNNATLYDAATWRRTGRLVPVTDRTRYKGGQRREAVDWTDVLDREAQELGVSAHDLPREFERLERSRARALSALREAEETRREARAIRSGAA